MTIDRRDLIKISAGAALAAQAGVADGRKPLFFTTGEFAMVDELTELIIPADAHSQGARAAQVAAYIDTRLAESFEPEPKQVWRDGLKTVDALSQEINNAPFMRASGEQRRAVVERMSKNERKPQTPGETFFAALKGATVHAYYTSKIGIHDEMQYKGNTMLNEFVGAEVT